MEIHILVHWGIHLLCIQSCSLITWTTNRSGLNLSAANYLRRFGVIQGIWKDWENLIKYTSHISENSVSVETISAFQSCLCIDTTFVDVKYVKTNQILKKLCSEKIYITNRKTEVNQEISLLQQVNTFLRPGSEFSNTNTWITPSI